jgi:hypothetical protein
MKKFECARFNKLISNYLDNNLNTRDFAFFYVHMRECPSCENALRMTSAIRSACVEEGARAANAPAGLHESIMGALREEEKNGVQKKTAWRFMPLKSVAVAVILLLSISVGLGASILIQNYKNRQDTAGVAMNLEYAERPAAQAADDGAAFVEANSDINADGYSYDVDNIGGETETGAGGVMDTGGVQTSTEQATAAETRRPAAPAAQTTIAAAAPAPATEAAAPTTAAATTQALDTASKIAADEIPEMTAAAPEMTAAAPETTAAATRAPEAAVLAPAIEEQAPVYTGQAAAPDNTDDLTDEPHKYAMNDLIDADIDSEDESIEAEEKLQESPYGAAGGSTGDAQKIPVSDIPVNTDTPELNIETDGEDRLPNAESQDNAGESIIICRFTYADSIDNLARNSSLIRGIARAHTGSASLTERNDEQAIWHMVLSVDELDAALADLSDKYTPRYIDSGSPRESAGGAITAVIQVTQLFIE